MVNIKNEVHEKFGHQLRVRVSGICFQGDSVLMVKHRGLSSQGYFWSPPGGAMQFGSSAEANLQREFKEETGLQVEVTDFLFVNEFLQSPLHAIELFFLVRRISGTLMTGQDPEMTPNGQIIEDVKFMSEEALGREQGPQIHSAFWGLRQPRDLVNLNGYFKFENNYIK